MDISQTEGRRVVARGWGRGEQKVVFSVCRIPVWGDEEVPEKGGGDWCPILWTSFMPQSCTPESGWNLECAINQ